MTVCVGGGGVRGDGIQLFSLRSAKLSENDKTGGSIFQNQLFTEIMTHFCLFEDIMIDSHIRPPTLFPVSSSQFLQRKSSGIATFSVTGSLQEMT